jgi:hypothetical protein
VINEDRDESNLTQRGSVIEYSSKLLLTQKESTLRVPRYDNPELSMTTMIIKP